MTELFCCAFVLFCFFLKITAGHWVKVMFRINAELDQVDKLHFFIATTGSNAVLMCVRDIWVKHISPYTVMSAQKPTEQSSDNNNC